LLTHVFEGDNKLYSWGQNSYGQLGNSSYEICIFYWLSISFFVIIC
jgi:alpha-tubulin suppressor-like RCC1 family protein